MASAGQPLREGAYLKDWYPHSRQITQVQQFWSHSWHGYVWPKIALLYTSCNGVAAVVCGSLVVPVVSFLLVVGMGIFQSPWPRIVGTLTSVFVLLAWRPSKTRCTKKL